MNYRNYEINACCSTKLRLRKLITYQYLTIQFVYNFGDMISACNIPLKAHVLKVWLPNAGGLRSRGSEEIRMES
jgi:hypothetical protein